MIVLSSCDCCTFYRNYYVVKCACGNTSKKCSQDTIEEAAESARNKGWVIEFPKLGGLGIWKCPNCKKKTDKRRRSNE